MVTETDKDAAPGGAKPVYRRRAEPRPPIVSIALVSGTALAYEILLLQLFSQVYWHHFAFLVISIALLGVGASGTLVTVLQKRIDIQPDRYYLGFLLSLAVSLQGAFPLAQRLPFNPLELSWSAYQSGWLALMFTILALPFLFAGSCISLALRRWGRRSGRIYGSDLCGAAAGAALIVWLMTVCFSSTCLRLLVSIALVALPVAWIEQRRPVRAAAGIGLLALAAIPWLIPESWLQPRPSQFKALAQTLRVPGTEVIARRPSPLGEVAVTAHRGIPLRYAPGLSILSPELPTDQLGLYVNGDLVGAIPEQGWNGGVGFLDWTQGALAYHLLRARGSTGPVLVLDAFQGTGLQQALFQGANPIVAVEPHRALARVTREFSRDGDPDLTATELIPVYRMPRAYLAASRQRFDLIALPPVGMGVAGAQVLKPWFDYSQEAIAGYWRHLSPTGLIAFEVEARLPPRTSLKLLATARAALEGEDVAHLQEHIAVIRSWNRVVLLLSRSPFSKQDIDEIRDFCRRRAFDLVYYSGLQPGDVNRYNQVADAAYFTGARAVLGPERESFYARYKFDLRPVTDRRPYLFHQLKLSSLGELFGFLRRGGEALLEWSYPLLLGGLAISLAGGAVLILLPLGLLRSRVPRRSLPARTAMALYFSAIGLGYLFLEIAMILEVSLHLGHPLMAVAAVLTAFLFFSGIGSLCSERLAGTPLGKPWLLFPLTALVAVLTWAGISSGMEATLRQLPSQMKVVTVLLWLAPLACLLGMPFPLAVRGLSAAHGEWVPWVWAINGCASVVSPILATILALHWGIPNLVYGAAMLYLLAGCFSGRLVKSAR